MAKRKTIHINPAFIDPDREAPSFYKTTFKDSDPITLLCGIIARNTVWWSSSTSFLNASERYTHVNYCKRCAKSRKIPMLLLKALNDG